MSVEEALTDTNSTGHGFTAIPVTLQPSQTPAAATPPGGSCGQNALLAQPGDSHPTNREEAELIRGTITWSSTTVKLPTPQRSTGFSRARARNHCSWFLAGTQGRTAPAARSGECQIGQRF